MKATFKVGDRVRIKRRVGKPSDYSFSFPDEMACLEGQIFTVREVKKYESSLAYIKLAYIKDDGYQYHLLGDGNNWSWASSMLEKAPDFTSDSTPVYTSESIIDFTCKKGHYQFNFSL